jgi:tRNA(adenine34) deaminase
MIYAHSAGMLIALEQARLAFDKAEVPVGAIIMEAKTGRVIASAHNQVKELNDPTAHAEIIAIRSAATLLGNARLKGFDIYVTLEPCAMCAQAISLARIRKLTFGAYDPKGGGVEHGSRVFSHASCNHVPEVIGGVEESASGGMLRKFFSQRREDSIVAK